MTNSLRVMPSVAIVGGGISGLVAGSRLSAAGLDVTVYDTGERACGGRASSRAVPAPSRSSFWEFDHSTQYFTATPGSEFAALVRDWEDQGLVTRWPEGAVGVLSNGTFEPFHDGLERYIGVGGYQPLCESIAGDCTRVVRPQWVGEMKPQGNGRWQLAKGPGRKPLGTYDFVVISHNGKCAARLAGTAKWSSGQKAAAKVERSLQCAFGVRPLDQLQRQQKLILSSIWVLMFVSPTPLDLAWEGAHITGSPTVAWASNITAKRRHGSSTTDPTSPGEECWVVHSTPQFAKANKVPQENIPDAKGDEVTSTMLRALEDSLGIAPGSIQPVYTRVQLWGAANPLTVAGVPAVFDSESHTGACGDWCLGPPCIEAAASSALALADAIEALLVPESAAKPEAAAMLNSLTVKWSPAQSAASPLGGFPGMEDSTCFGSLPEPGSGSPPPSRKGGSERRRGRGRGRHSPGNEKPGDQNQTAPQPTTVRGRSGQRRERSRVGGTETAPDLLSKPRRATQQTRSCMGGVGAPKLPPPKPASRRMVHTVVSPARHAGPSARLAPGL